LLADLAIATARLAASRDDMLRAIAADAAWHEALTGHSRNRKLLEQLRLLRSSAARYERAFFGTPANLEQSVREHERIEALLREGAIADAADAVEAHWLENIAPMQAAVAQSDPPAGAR
jgi:DNA-binding GntR family transcriptional regulator